MQVEMTVEIKTNAGLDLGTFSAQDNDIPHDKLGYAIARMSDEIVDMPEVMKLSNGVDETLGPEGYGARTISELMRGTDPRSADEQTVRPPAPSVPRRDVNPRAVASGETRLPEHDTLPPASDRVPDDLRGTPAGNEMLREGLSVREGRRLYYIDRVLAGVRDVGRAWKEDRTVEYGAAVSRAVAAAYNLAVDRYMPRHLAGLLDYITPEESAADVLADLFALFAQANGEMERRGLKGYRSMRVFDRAAQWIRDNRPDLVIEPGYLPERARPAWEPRQPTGRVRWSPGDMVRLNDVSAEIFNTPPIRRRILMHIARERYRHTEEKQWTAAHDDKHRVNDWIAIIVQELGPGVYADMQGPLRRDMFIKVAAVATAAAEALDRKDPQVRDVLAEMERKQAEGHE